MLIKYSSNNSGGSWWLKDKDWKALAKAGWKVVWAWEEYVYKDGDYTFDKKGLPKTQVKHSKDYRWLGTIAKYAHKKFDSVKDALVEFEKLTDANVMDEGCNCCGAPHSFSWKDGYCSGEDCGEYLYGAKATKSKRQLLEDGA